MCLDRLKYYAYYCTANGLQIANGNGFNIFVSLHIDNIIIYKARKSLKRQCSTNTIEIRKHSDSIPLAPSTFNYPDSARLHELLFETHFQTFFWHKNYQPVENDLIKRYKNRYVVFNDNLAYSFTIILITTIRHKRGGLMNTFWHCVNITIVSLLYGPNTL